MERPCYFVGSRREARDERDIGSGCVPLSHHGAINAPFFCTAMKYDEFSSDGYVRIPASALRSITLRHITTAKDQSIAAVDVAIPATAVTGYTEWVGTWEGAPVSLGWDWALVEGTVIVINADELRTNIQLLSSDFRPEPRATARAHLLAWIESISWREAPFEAIRTQ